MEDTNTELLEEWHEYLDAMTAAPQHHQVLLENDDVRVLEQSQKAFQHLRRWDHREPANQTGTAGCFQAAHRRKHREPVGNQRRRIVDQALPLEDRHDPARYVQALENRRRSDGVWRVGCAAIVPW